MTPNLRARVPVIHARELLHFSYVPTQNDRRSTGMVATANTISAERKITIPTKTIYISFHVGLLTMPSLQVNDDGSEDDTSVVLEGGKHMFCHDIG